MHLPPDIWELNPDSSDLRAARRRADAKGFPRPWHILAFNVLVAAALDAWAFFGKAMPGPSTRLILSHLREDGTPPVSNILWGYFVRLGDFLPGVSISAWMAGVSMACGVACVAILTALLLHKGYWVVEKSSPQAVARESFGRRMAGLSGGLFLAVSAPFWVASTRAFPMTFHLLLILLTVCGYEFYHETGRRLWLGAFLFLWGVTATQTDTGWYVGPVALWLGFREMLQWNHHRSWLAWLAYVLAPLAGLSLYAVCAWLVWRRGQWLGLYPGGLWEAFQAIFRAQFSALYTMHFSPALLVFACVLGVPWCTLFLLSHRCPWCYEGAEIFIRVVFGIGLASIAWTPPYAPCFLVVGGLVDPPVAPSLVLAVCFGCTVGETWIMGDLRPRIDNTAPKRFLRRSMTVLSLLLLPAVAGAAVRNAGLAKIPDGLWTFRAVSDVFDQRGRREAMVCGAPFDDLMLMEMRERREGWLVMSHSRAANKEYLKLLAMRFTAKPDVAAYFGQGNFDAGMRAWLDDPEALERTMLIGRPDVYNEYGWLAPVGIAYRIELDAKDADIDGILRSQRPFWERVAESASLKLHPLNPYAGHWQLCNVTVARQINDVGVRAAGEGRPELAEELFELANRISPSNLSVKMNRIRIARRLGLPEEEIAKRKEEWEGETYARMGLRWVLAAVYGYVWEPDSWMREGVVWALSGKPTSEPAARRKSALERAVDGRFEQWLDQAFMVAGLPEIPEVTFRNILMSYPWATDPLLEIARLALRAKQPEIADAYYNEAVAHGLREEKLLYERAMADYVRLRFAGNAGGGEREDAFPAGVPLADLDLPSPLNDPGRWTDAGGTVRAPRDVFLELSTESVADMRIWMTLYLLVEDDPAETGRIEKLLKTQRPNDPDLWLTLCSIHIRREAWEKAREELDKALHLGADRVALWEMTMSVAEHYGNARLLLSARNRLLRMQPFHFLAQQQEGQELYNKGDLQGAARVFEKGIFFKRDPVLLNNLAHVLTEIDPEANYRDAMLLIDEAIKRDPDRLGFYVTRANIHLRHGDPAAALRDMRRVLDKRKGLAEFLLLAEIFRELDDVPRAEAALRKAESLNVEPRFEERQRIFGVRDWIDLRRGKKGGEK